MQGVSDVAVATGPAATWLVQLAITNEKTTASMAGLRLEAFFLFDRLICWTRLESPILILKRTITNSS